MRSPNSSHANSSSPMNTMFQLHPLTADDLPALVQLWYDAFSIPINLRLFPDTPGVRAWLEDYHRASLARSDQHYLKITADPASSPPLVAMVKWDFNTTAPGHRFPAWPVDSDQGFCDAFFGSMDEARRHIMGPRPHYCGFLPGSMPLCGLMDGRSRHPPHPSRLPAARGRLDVAPLGLRPGRSRRGPHLGGCQPGGCRSLPALWLSRCQCAGGHPRGGRLHAPGSGPGGCFVALWFSLDSSSCFYLLLGLVLPIALHCLVAAASQCTRFADSTRASHG